MFKLRLKNPIKVTTFDLIISIPTEIFMLCRQTYMPLKFSLLIFILLHMGCDSFAQNGKKSVMGYIIEQDGDTLIVGKIAPAYSFNRPENRKKSREWRQYYRTVYNFNKVYPYALKAKEILKDADSTLLNSGFNKREKEKYLRSYQNRLFKEFEKPLRNMTIGQGQLLLKLIDREVGRTSFYVIRNYRGGAAAGFWQGIAKLFGSDLKKPYDKFGEDKAIEELVKMYEDGSFFYLYYSLFGVPPGTK